MTGTTLTMSAPCAPRFCLQTCKLKKLGISRRFLGRNFVMLSRLRSGSEMNTNNSFVLTSDGSYNWNNVHNVLAVRPALHL